MSPRHWVTPVPGRPDHVWRQPYFGVGAAVWVAIAGVVVPEGSSSQTVAAALLPSAALVLGACWSNDPPLDTRVPVDLSPEALLAYGAVVANELEDRGYSALDILEVGNAVRVEFTRRQSIVRMAEERATFTVAPEVDSTLSS